jgi:hypothetical protein
VLNRIVDLIDDGWHRRFWRSRLQFRTLTARGLDLADAGGCLQRLVDRHHLRIEHGLSVLSNDDFLDDETATFATVSRDRSVFDGETDQRAIAYTGE